MDERAERPQLEEEKKPAGGVPDIYISSRAPLLVSEASATMHYHNVYMEVGAYIEIRAGSKFEIDNLSLCEEGELTDLQAIREYPTPATEERRVNGSYHIILTGMPGKNGKDGLDATEPGESGDGGEDAPEPGGNAPGNFTLVIHETNVNVTILSTGGTGGNGGDGGSGAKGYSGGIGGDGGDGGNGSNGGDAANMLTVQYGLCEGIEPPVVDCVKAPGGKGGKGGKAGPNGESYSGSEKGKKGANGSGGLPGQIGKAQIQRI